MATSIFKNKIAFLIMTIVVSASYCADGTYGRLKVNKVIRVYDGDTFFANINSVHSIIGDTIGIRIDNIDTPEIRGSSACEKAAAYKAKKFVEEKLRNAKKIEIRNIQRGKYFRIVADVYIDNRNLADLIISAGLAVPYSGGTKMKFVCDK
jgi:endonuclease YncB( thermonuclease family)